MNISRGTICNKFSGNYQQMTEADKDTFSKCCNKLLVNNYIYGQLKEDKSDYYSIVRLKDEIEQYFSLIDYTLEQDGNYKIFFLKSKSGKGRIKLKKMESILVLLFRKFYYVKGKEVNAAINVFISYDELIDEINKTLIYKDKLSKVQLFDSLKLLKRYKIIDFDLAHYNETDTLELFPTILYVVTDMDLKMIEDKLASYQNSDDGETKDETEED